MRILNILIYQIKKMYGIDIVKRKWLTHSCISIRCDTSITQKYLHSIFQSLNDHLMSSSTSITSSTTSTKTITGTIRFTRTFTTITTVCTTSIKTRSCTVT